MKLSARQIIIGILVCAALLVLMVIAGFIAWRFRLANDVDRQLAALHAAGLPTNGREANDYYTAVPDDENAALKIEDAFSLMTNYPDARSNAVAAIRFPRQTDTLTPQQLDLLKGYVAMNSSALAAARKAVQFPRCRYPVDLSLGANALFPHLSPLRRLALLAAFDSIVDATNSVNDISTVIGIARTLDNEPVLISKLVRNALLNIAGTAMERRLSAGGLDDADLARLNEVLAKTDLTNQMANGLIGERAMNIPYFRMSQDERKRLGNSGDEDPSKPARPPLPGPQPFVVKSTGFFERDLRFYLRSMATNILLAETFPKNVSQITNVQNEMVQTARRHYYVFSMMLLPALDRAIFRDATMVAQTRCALSALAIERFRLAHGALPADLDQISPEYLPAIPDDPFNGQPLHYRRTGNSYVVYSVGSDQEDNGGVERPANARPTDKNHYDITFTVEH